MGSTARAELSSNFSSATSSGEPRARHPSTPRVSSDSGTTPFERASRWRVGRPVPVARLSSRKFLASKASRRRPPVRPRRDEPVGQRSSPPLSTPPLLTTRRSRGGSGLRKGEHTTWRTRLEPHASKVDVRDVRRVDVAAEDRYRGGRVAIEADGAEQVDETAKRELVCRPMLEVHGPPQPLTESLEEGTPSTIADRLVPCLQVVDPGRKEHREARRDDEVVERAVRVFDDPVPLLLRHHLPSAFDDDPGSARVEDEKP